MIRITIARVRAVACFVTVLALMTAGTAAANSPEANSHHNGSYTIAAADSAGWLLFKGHRSSRADHLAPSSVGLDNVANPETPYTSAADSLSRWGSVRASISTR